MRVTRRSLLPLPLVAVVAGCTPDPTVHGTAGPAAEAVAPTRGPGAAAVASWAADLDAELSSLALGAAAWGADATHLAWVTALRTQSSAHLSRLVAADPVSGGPTAFPAPSPQASTFVPTTPEAALEAVTTRVAAGEPVLTAAVAAAGTGAERLLYASIAAAWAGSTTVPLPPVDGGAEPAAFEDLSMPAALGVALSHVWALIRGLELGLGRLPRDHPLQEQGTSRLDAAKGLRNDLLEALPGEPPRVRSWALPTAMSTPEEIREGWALLETSLLDAVAALVAAGGAEPRDWLPILLAQVDEVHRWGGRLTHWPGWVAAP